MDLVLLIEGPQQYVLELRYDDYDGGGRISEVVSRNQISQQC